MTQELAPKSTKLSGGERLLVSNPRWSRLTLAAVLTLSAPLNLFQITQEGWGNPYYAAGVERLAERLLDLVVLAAMTGLGVLVVFGRVLPTEEYRQP